MAGSTTLGIAVAELKEVAAGWSVGRQILGQIVYNHKDEKVGKVDDILVAPDKATSYAIVDAGGFLGVGKRDVAIPPQSVQIDDHKLVLAGASNHAIKGMPEFDYTY